MKKIRTTVTLPEYLHKEIKMVSVRDQKSFSEVIAERLKQKGQKPDKNWSLRNLAGKYKVDNPIKAEEIRNHIDYADGKY